MQQGQIPCDPQWLLVPRTLPVEPNKNKWSRKDKSFPSETKPNEAEFQRQYNDLIPNHWHGAQDCSHIQLVSLSNLLKQVPQHGRRSPKHDRLSQLPSKDKNMEES